MPTVKFVKEKKEIEVPKGANLRTEAMKAGINLYNGINGVGASINQFANCLGFGVCGTCRVIITDGVANANAITGVEQFTFHNPVDPAAFAFIGNEDKMRLACCVEVNGDMTVETGPPLNLFGENFFS